MRLLGIEWVPLYVPLERRLQTLAVIYTLFEYLFGIYSYLLFFGLLFTKYYYVTLLYFTWMYYDRHTCRKGGRLVGWVKNLTLYKYYANYFPMRLEKTVDLDCTKNYIFGYHPHGILASGAFGNFATNGTGFDKLFPGITARLVTLEMNFWFPIHRDLSLLRGHISAQKESIEYVLKNCSTGNAVVLVVGGAQEAIDAVPDTMKLTLKPRKGFIRLALQHGASLVPVISFGENEIYVQAPHDEKSLMRKLQVKLKEVFRFTLPIFHGRGVFQYSMGIIPFRTPIHTVIGSPIIVEKVDEPTKEEVDKLHEKYMHGLKELFKMNKDKYARNPKLELELQ